MSAERLRDSAADAPASEWDGVLHFTPAARDGVVRHLKRARANAESPDPPGALLVTLNEEEESRPDLRLIPASRADTGWARLELPEFTVFLRGAGVDRLRGGTVEYVAEPEAGFRFHTDGEMPPSEEGEPQAPGQDDSALAESVREALEETVNPMVAAHGGAIRLVRVRDGVAEIEMEGGCQGCIAARATLRSIVERAVRAAVPDLHDVQDVTDHAAGDDPYLSA